MKYRRAIFVPLAMAMIAGCATEDVGTFENRVQARPLPSNDEERARECKWLNAESQRQIERLNRRELQYWGLVKTVERTYVEEHLTTLQTRASRLHCSE